MNLMLLYYKYKWLIPESMRTKLRLLRGGKRLAEIEAKTRDKLFKQLDGTVASGPFAGMKYIEDSTARADFTKILGTYEKELYDVVQSICNHAYPVIIDIGAAEGYYAVGMAIRSPQTHIIAFEQSEKGRQLLRGLADRNRISSDRLSIEGECTAKLLSQALKSRSGEIGNCSKLVVCDVEGAEVELLDPVETPELLKTDVLVELHDCLRPRVRDTILARFGSTHMIQHVLSRSRRVEECPVAAGLAGPEAVAALWENRSRQAEWYWMKCNG